MKNIFSSGWVGNAPSAYAVDWDFSEFVDFSDFSFLSANFGRSKFDGTPLVYPADFASQVLSQNLNQQFLLAEPQSTESTPDGTTDQVSLRHYSYAVSDTSEDGRILGSADDELAAVDQHFQDTGQTLLDDSNAVSQQDSNTDPVELSVGSNAASDTPEDADHNEALSGELTPALPFSTFG